MFAIPFIVLTLASGVLIGAAMGRGHPLRSFRGFIETVALSLLAPSFVGILLVEAANFRPVPILTGLLVAAVLLAVIFCVSRRAAKSQEHHLRRAAPLSVPLLAVLLVGAAVRYPPLNYVRGGQDPGVYVNIANSLARTGQLTIVDPIAEPLSKRDTPLGKIYFNDSYRAMLCKADGGCRGSFQPGFYLRGIAPSEIVPQFYHLHPIWMALSNLCFGGAHTTGILFVFGLLSLALFYLLLSSLCRTPRAAVCGTLFLACSPAYAYFARWTVSEVTASLFFLAALCFLITGRLRHLPELIVGGLFLGLFFFTHITGFIFLPLLYPALLLAAYRYRSSGPIIGWLTACGAFLWSLLHGLRLSRPYALAIWTKIGLPDPALDFITQNPVLFSLSAVGITLLPFLALTKARPAVDRVIGLLPRKKVLTILSTVALVAFGAYVVYKAYLLGYTNHYAENRWIGRRWSLSGHGLWSVKHLTAAVLTFFVSPFVVLLAGIGWVRLARRSVTSPTALLLALVAGGLTLALVGKQTTAPYLYYFGRYLVPTVVPIAILLAALGLEALRFRRQRTTLAVHAALVIGALGCMLPFTVAQARSDEAGDLYLQLERLAQTVGPKAIIFVDEVNFARVELTTPLQISFGIPTITYSRREFTGEPLRGLMAEAHELGYEVFLLSEKDRKDLFPFLNRVDRFEFFLGSLVAPQGGVMPTVFRGGKQLATLHKFVPASAPTVAP